MVVVALSGGVGSPYSSLICPKIKASPVGGGGSCCPGLPYLMLVHLRLPYLPKNKIAPVSEVWWCYNVG
jgi:hypothetical protein